MSQKVSEMERYKFNPGDIACSTIGGFYSGYPGRVIGKAQLQFGEMPRYVIELEGLDKCITLRADRMKLIKRR